MGINVIGEPNILYWFFMGFGCGFMFFPLLSIIMQKLSKKAGRDKDE